MTVTQMMYGTLAVALVAGVVLWYRRKDLDLAERIILFVSPAIGAIFAGRLLVEFLECFFRIFTDARLAPAASLLHGYRLYYPLEEGPILGMMYSPLAAIMYVPAVAASTPEVAVGIAQILTMLYYFGPPASVLFVESRRAGISGGVGMLVFLSFGFTTELSGALSYPAFRIHADAPALGFAGLACAWLHFRKSDSRFTSFLGPAILATCAVLSKQVAVGMLAAVPICALYFEGRQACVRATLAVAAAVLAGGAVVLVTLSVEGLLLNAVYMPARQPWSSGPIRALTRAGMELMETSLCPLGIIAVSAFLLRRESVVAAQQASDRWKTWVIVAAINVPCSILGRVKVLGDVNALAYTVYFLAVAAHLRMIHICARNGDLRAKMPDEARIGILYVVISLAIWTVPDVIDRFPPAVARFPNNPERVGFEFAKQHPGEVYFPFHPLIALMSEGKAYHFSDGIGNRELGGMIPSQSHIRAFLPEHMEFIAFTDPTDHSQKYVPEFSKKTRIDELKGWSVFTRGMSADVRARNSDGPK